MKENICKRTQSEDSHLQFLTYHSQNSDLNSSPTTSPLRFLSKFSSELSKVFFTLSLF